MVPQTDSDGGSDDKQTPKIPATVKASKVKYIKSVADGNHTAQAVSDDLDMNYSNVNRQLGNLAERDDAPLGVDKTASPYRYEISDATANAADSGASGATGGDDDATPAAAKVAAQAAESAEIVADGMTIERPDGASMDVILEARDRITERVPDEAETTEYRQFDGEWTEAVAMCETAEARGVTPGPVGYWLVGPTGSGKTVFAKALAAKIAASYYEIQVGYSLDPSDLVGFPVEGRDGILRYAAGPLAQALWASRQGPVVIVLDEINRAPAAAKDVLFGALDSRSRLTLDAAGGATIQGKPENIVVVSTANEGPDYQTEQVDLAERGRIGKRVEVDYVGVNHPEREAELIAEQTPASEDFATLLVRAANAVRNERPDDGEQAGRGDIARGVPTRYLIDAAGFATQYAEAEVPNPAWRAVERTVIGNHYYDSPAADKVRSLLRQYLDGVDPLNYDASEANTPDPESQITVPVHVTDSGARGASDKTVRADGSTAHIAFAAVRQEPEALDDDPVLLVETEDKNIGQNYVKKVADAENERRAWDGNAWEIPAKAGLMRAIIENLTADGGEVIIAAPVANRFRDGIPGGEDL